jgi:glycosyltransferase involved in cell wall biosynthesis
VNKQDYILWLPSWYPNEAEPYNGDFIQRHANAAALYNNITVIFFTQYGEAVTTKHKVSKTVSQNLNQITVYVPFEPWGIQLIDKIRYNVSFYRFSKNFLKAFIQENGLPSLVHVHVPVKAGNLALWIRKKFGVPYIVSEHASTYSKNAKDSFFSRHWLYRLQVKKIFSDAAVVTNVSLAIGKLLKELFALKNVEVIHNVVDTDIFKPIFLPKEIFTYVHVSSLNDQKNIFGILRVFKKLSTIRTDWKFIVVGPYSEKIKSFIVQEQLAHLIYLTGEVPYSMVASYMNHAHVMVLFSKHENFPCVVIEALCCGLLVVSSDVAGINEAVNSSNGILVEPENEDALQDALIEIRENYDSYNRESVAADAARKFGYLPVAKKISELYKFVVD